MGQEPHHPLPLCTTGLGHLLQHLLSNIALTREGPPLVHNLTLALHHLHRPLHIEVPIYLMNLQTHMTSRMATILLAELLLVHHLQVRQG
jgi:hypothetical protein